MTNLPPWLVQFAFLYDPGPPTKSGTTHSELGLPTCDANQCPVDLWTSQFDSGHLNWDDLFLGGSSLYKIDNIDPPHSSALLAINGF